MDRDGYGSVIRASRYTKPFHRSIDVTMTSAALVNVNYHLLYLYCPVLFSVGKPLPHLFFPDSLYHCILCILYGYAIQTVIMRSRTANAFLNLFPRTSTAPASCFGCSVRHKHLRTHAGYNSIADNTCSSGDRRTWSIHFKLGLSKRLCLHLFKVVTAFIDLLFIIYCALVGCSRQTVRRCDIGVP